MAREFDDAQNEYLLAGNVLGFGGWPITMACWAYLDDSADNNRTLMSIGDTNKTSDYSLLGVRDAPDVDVFLISDLVVGGIAIAIADGSVTLNTWTHCAAVFSGNQARAVYMSGANKVENNADSVAWGSYDDFGVGVIVRQPFSQYWSGRIAWPAVWNIALSDDEIASLAAGTHPTRIRPDNLVSFWPLGGLDTEETDGGTARDIWGGFDLTANSDAVGPGIADHPGGLIYPCSPQLVIPAAAAGVTVPVMDHHYRSMRAA